MDSSMNFDVVEKLLQTTGLSCDDLLAKLQEYKTKQSSKDAKTDSSEATEVPEEQPSIDQQCTKTDEGNPVILEAESCKSDDNATEQIVNLELSANTNDDDIGTKPAEIISDQPSSTENTHCKSSSDELSTITTVNQTVKDTSEKKIVENTTNCDNIVDVPTDSIANEVVEKKTSSRRNSDQFEDFLFCNEKGDDISDSIKVEVEDILKKLELQDSENKSENVSTSSITNDEDCFDSSNFHHSDDSSSFQKDELQVKEDNISNKIAEGNEKATENVPSCPSIEDHNYSNPKNNSQPEQDLSKSSTEEASKSEEDLSNIIRMQLSSLRNMKKSTTYLPDLQKRRSIFFHNLKKKRKSCDVAPARPLSSNSNETSDCKETEENRIDNIKEVDVKDDSLVSLCDETGFVIMDVTGGVDRVTEKNSEATSTKNEERRFAAIAETNRKPKSRYGYTSPMKRDKSKLLTIKNYSGTFSEDPGINKSVKNSEKSPFVSDSLDDFLNESSQLKISYAIPKLGAEDGISESTKKNPYEGVVGKTPRIDPDIAPLKEKPKLIKAKTVAEMRRQIEKLKLKKKVHYPLQVKKVEPMKEESEDNSKETILKDYNISVVPRHRNSFVVYNKRKTWVSTRITSNCVAVIDSPRKINKEDIGERTIPSQSPKVVPIVNRKLSLLSTLNQKKSCKIGYKAGPLCKKVELQNLESRDTWKTELKTLPKIYLEVVPEVGKPIDPNFVHVLPIFDDCVITEERANFALSVLKPKNETLESQTYNFHVPYYNNQEKMLVRKRCEPMVCKPNLSDDLSKNESDPTTDIANIIEDIIRYIEVKEIEDTLIKEDDPVVKEEPETINTSPKTKPRKHKKKKLELELARLSCKVIDVKTETTVDKECRKLYCKMGCVCKSLLCDSVFSDHCQLVECMFGCKCPPTNETNVSNNSLSAHTVNHLEDKAKKNLAKVEREFTQTLIHTDNDVILVGAGRNRGRTTKIPKKFTDFVGTLDEIILEDPVDVVQEKQKITLKRCTVDVPKLNLKYVIPYCLYHNVHDCDCKGEMTEFSTSVAKVPKLRIVKAKEDVQKTWYNSCARIREIFPQYKERNKDPKYNERLRANSFKIQTDPRFRIVQPNIKEDFSYGDLLSNFRETSETQSPKTPSKRKQSFNIREDVLIKSSPKGVKSNKVEVEKEFALQRRKKKLKPNGHLNDNSIASTYYPIFDGEIRVNLKDNQDMLKIIGEENASLEYLRILPWTKVIESFQLRKMNIWAKEKRSSALLCNAVGYFPPKYFVDIRRVHHKSDIVNWILTDNLPPDRPRELMHLILTPRKDHFMISGYCLKKVESSDKPVEQSTCLDGNTSDTAKFDSNIAPACVKLEPTDPDKISTSDEYFENLAISEQLTEEPPSPEPMEDNENDQSTESLDSVLDARNQHTPFNESCNKSEEKCVSGDTNESKLNIKPMPMSSSPKIRTVSLSDLLEPKLKQMQASRANLNKLHPIFKEIIPNETPPISISDLLASTTSIKQMQSFASSSLQVKKTISLSELLSKSGVVPSVQSVSKLERVELMPSLKKVDSDIRIHKKHLSSPEKLESRTTPSQVQSVASPSLHNSEFKTGSQSMISSEEAELMSLLESSNSKAEANKMHVTDMNLECVSKEQSTPSVPSSELVIAKSNELSVPSVNSNLVSTTMEQHISQIISKPAEYGTQRAQTIAVLQPSQSIKNIKIIQNMTASAIFERRTNTMQIKGISVLKSPESRMKQAQMSLSDSEAITKISLTPIQSHQLESETITKGITSSELLEAKIKSLKSLPVSELTTSSELSEDGNNNEQIQPCSSSEPEATDPLGDTASYSSFEDNESITDEPNESTEVMEDVAPTSTEVMEDTTPKSTEVMEDTTPTSTEVMEDTTLTSTEVMEDTTPTSTEVMQDISPTEPVSVPVPPESTTVSQALEPEPDVSQTETINAEVISSEVKDAEVRSSEVKDTENVTRAKKDESEAFESPKRSQRVSVRMNRAIALRESKKLQSRQPNVNPKQTIKQSTNQQKGTHTRSLKCTHKDMYNKNKTLLLTNKEYAKRRLYFIDQETGVNGTLAVPLPKVAKTFKWRMIYLNSDFSYLSFVRANYSIKYTDLMDVVKMSSNIKTTITLKNKEFTSQYKHPLFGIWCVPDYQDRLFIGPYLPLEKNNIETLRYLQRKLIDTQIFNKMVGKKVDEKNPTWLYETLPKSFVPNTVVIDITEEDNIKIIDPNIDIYVIDDDSEQEESEQDFIFESLLCPPFVEKLTEEELKMKKINRYIITNIPHLGYFGACQRDSKAIEVFWPDGVRGYRFPNVTFAKNALLLYLSQNFCPIPQDFKLNVVIMTNLDLESNKPVDPKYFTQTEPYICGEFGIYEKNAVPKDLLERHGITSLESLLKSDERLEDNDHKMIKLFGLFLMSNEELRKHSEPAHILQWASSEIYISKKLGENYKSEKADLHNIIRTNRLKVQEIKQKKKTPRSVASPGKRINTAPLKITETIEIDDSDEDNQTKSAPVNEPAFKKFCTSGKIQTGITSPKNEGRSLLKPQFTLTGRSLLKVNDTDKQKVHLMDSSSSNGSTNSIEISVNNSNIIVNHSNLVITKMNQTAERSE